MELTGEPEREGNGGTVKEGRGGTVKEGKGGTIIANTGSGNTSTKIKSGGFVG